jgi:6-phosphofructokinase 1
MTKILILTSGGDAPGMNAVVRAVVRSAIYRGIEVYASHSGYEGLVKQQLMKLETTSVANCIQLGGTIIKTGRCEAFFDKSVRAECIKFLKKEGIDYLVVIGGDGSFRGATALYEENGPPVIGIPGTIDNDITGSEYTIGFDTARNTALGAIDKIRDTASSHNRNFMVEVMGRNAGFLAVDVGISGGAEYILIPEFPMNAEQLAQRIHEMRPGKLSSIIVVAEGDSPGHTIELAKNLNQLTNKDYRACVLGHIQRGGNPSALDRKYASLMGAKAIEALSAGIKNKMIAVINDKIVVTEFPDPAQPSRKFQDIELLKTNEIICG